MIEGNEAARAHGESRKRLRLEVTGAVQGVGFRPFIHRLAASERLAGFVRNTDAGVSLEVEGAAPAIDRFLARMDAEIAPPAAIHGRRLQEVPAQGETDFLIADSACLGRHTATVLPDLATCPECLADIFDPHDRRHLYPFTTCVHCGPRYSIIEAVPYDRARTTMRRFAMCRACLAEYEDPASRRFHAETNACPDCGPQVSLWNGEGDTTATGQTALLGAIERLRRGAIVALKGLGGFQLFCDAADADAVARLRQRKRRPAKPFAIMAADMAQARALAKLSDAEERLLASPAAPIVLVRRRDGASTIADDVAPENPWLGVMLPYTPLHHILLRAFGGPLVATSGNLGDEPIIADEAEARETLAGVADLFLVHDRPILRRVDDSVVRVVAGRDLMLRRARGYAPLAIAAPIEMPSVLACGGHQKNALAVAGGDRIVLGPHIGDLGGLAARAAYSHSIDAFTTLHGNRPALAACDEHPDYYSSHVAERSGLPVRRVPHHLAHVLAGMADNGIDGPVLGIAWDGTGFGRDGTIWGSEVLAVEGTNYRRVAHLLPFRLPGGEAAVKEPRRAAFGVLHAIFGEAACEMTDIPPIAAFHPPERRIVATMLASGVNSPLASSAGRLFDAVASLLDLRQTASFEGEAAMAVEFAAGRAQECIALPPLGLAEGQSPMIIDWRDMVAGLVRAVRAGAARPAIAAAFHTALVDGLVALARRAGIGKVLLTGGCFQNVRLSEQAMDALREAGFDPHMHHRIPPNDGGLAVGQAIFVARPLIEETG